MEGEQKEKKKDFLMVMQLMMCNQNENETDIKKNIWNETKTLQAAQHGQKKQTKNFFQMVLVVVITITFMLEIYPQIIELPRQHTEKR